MGERRSGIVVEIKKNEERELVFGHERCFIC